MTISLSEFHEGRMTGGEPDEVGHGDVPVTSNGDNVTIQTVIAYDVLFLVVSIVLYVLISKVKKLSGRRKARIARFPRHGRLDSASEMTSISIGMMMVVTVLGLAGETEAGSEVKPLPIKFDWELVKGRICEGANIPGNYQKIDSDDSQSMQYEEVEITPWAFDIEIDAIGLPDVVSGEIKPQSFTTLIGKVHKPMARRYHFHVTRVGNGGCAIPMTLQTLIQVLNVAQGGKPQKKFLAVALSYGISTLQIQNAINRLELILEGCADRSPYCYSCDMEGSVHQEKWEKLCKSRQCNRRKVVMKSEEEGVNVFKNSKRLAGTTQAAKLAKCQKTPYDPGLIRDQGDEHNTPLSKEHLAQRVLPDRVEYSFLPSLGGVESTGLIKENYRICWNDRCPKNVVECKIAMATEYVTYYEMKTADGEAYFGATQMDKVPSKCRRRVISWKLEYTKLSTPDSPYAVRVISPFGYYEWIENDGTCSVSYDVMKPFRMLFQGKANFQINYKGTVVKGFTDGSKQVMLSDPGKDEPMTVRCGSETITTVINADQTQVCVRYMTVMGSDRLGRFMCIWLPIFILIAFILASYLTIWFSTKFVGDLPLLIVNAVVCIIPSLLLWPLHSKFKCLTCGCFNYPMHKCSKCRICNQRVGNTKIPHYLNCHTKWHSGIWACFRMTAGSRLTRALIVVVMAWAMIATLSLPMIGAESIREKLIDSHGFLDSHIKIPFGTTTGAGISFVDKTVTDDGVSGRITVDLRLQEGATESFKISDDSLAHDIDFTIKIPQSKMDTFYSYRYTTCPDKSYHARHKTACVASCASFCKNYANGDEVGYCWSDINRWFCEPLNCASVNQGALCVACKSTPDMSDCTDVYQRQSKMPRYTICVRDQTGVACRKMTEEEALDTDSFKLFVTSFNTASHQDLPQLVAIRRKDKKIYSGKICEYGIPSSSCFGSVQYIPVKGRLNVKFQTENFKGDWHCNGVALQTVEVHQCHDDTYRILNNLDTVHATMQKDRDMVILTEETVDLGILGFSIMLDGLPRKVNAIPTELSIGVHDCEGCEKCKLGMECKMTVTTDVPGVYDLSCDGFALERDYVIIKRIHGEEITVYMSAPEQSGQMKCQISMGEKAAVGKTDYALEKDPKEIYQERERGSVSTAEDSKPACFIICGFDIGLGSAVNAIIEILMVGLISILGMILILRAAGYMWSMRIGGHKAVYTGYQRLKSAIPDVETFKMSDKKD